MAHLTRAFPLIISYCLATADSFDFDRETPARRFLSKSSGKYTKRIKKGKKTSAPSQYPSREPSDYPSQEPSREPSPTPTKAPTQTPTKTPTKTPTQTPTQPQAPGEFCDAVSVFYVFTPSSASVYPMPLNFFSEKVVRTFSEDGGEVISTDLHFTLRNFYDTPYDDAVVFLATTSGTNFTNGTVPTEFQSSSASGLCEKVRPIDEGESYEFTTPCHRGGYLYGFDNDETTPDLFQPVEEFTALVVCIESSGIPSDESESFELGYRGALGSARFVSNGGIFCPDSDLGLETPSQPFLCEFRTVVCNSDCIPREDVFLTSAPSGAPSSDPSSAPSSDPSSAPSSAPTCKRSKKSSKSNESGCSSKSSKSKDEILEI